MKRVGFPVTGFGIHRLDAGFRQQAAFVGSALDLEHARVQVVGIQTSLHSHLASRWGAAVFNQQCPLTRLLHRLIEVVHQLRVLPKVGLLRIVELCAEDFQHLLQLHGCTHLI